MRDHFEPKSLSEMFLGTRKNESIECDHKEHLVFTRIAFVVPHLEHSRLFVTEAEFYETAEVFGDTNPSRLEQRRLCLSLLPLSLSLSLCMSLTGRTWLSLFLSSSKIE